MAPVRYLALGDSYTIGEGVDSVDTWPVRLLARLVHGGQDAAAPDVVAQTGWTSDELLAALDRAVPTPPYTLVSLLVGVNDQYRDRGVDEHLPHFNRLLNQAIRFAGGDASRVFVVSIPDWGVSEFGRGDARGGDVIRAAIDAYNRAQHELCGRRGIAWVDITAVSRALAGNAAMFVDDRLHPSAAQYARWLEAIEPVAQRCLP